MIRIQKSNITTLGKISLQILQMAFSDFKFLEGKTVCIEGTIGAGKSTLGAWMEASLNKSGIKAKFFPEYVNQPLLGLFIQDPPKYAYAFQLFMLNRRQMTIEVCKRDALAQGCCCILDRSMRGDRVFLELQREAGNITEEEYKIYLTMYEEYATAPPDYTLYLQCSLDTTVGRIQKRARTGENCYPIEYLDRLNSMYESEFTGTRSSDVIVVDWNHNMSEQCLASDQVMRDFLLTYIGSDDAVASPPPSGAFSPARSYAGSGFPSASCISPIH